MTIVNRTVDQRWMQNTEGTSIGTTQVDFSKVPSSTRAITLREHPRVYSNFVHTLFPDVDRRVTRSTFTPILLREARIGFARLQIVGTPHRAKVDDFFSSAGD